VWNSWKQTEFHSAVARICSGGRCLIFDGQLWQQLSLSSHCISDNIIHIIIDFIKSISSKYDKNGVALFVCF